MHKRIIDIHETTGSFSGKILCVMWGAEDFLYSYIKNVFIIFAELYLQACTQIHPFDGFL